jgi:hypothetical protein
MVGQIPTRQPAVSMDGLKNRPQIKCNQTKWAIVGFIAIHHLGKVFGDVLYLNIVSATVFPRKQSFRKIIL